MLFISDLFNFANDYMLNHRVVKKSNFFSELSVFCVVFFFFFPCLIYTSQSPTEKPATASL